MNTAKSLSASKLLATALGLGLILTSSGGAEPLGLKTRSQGEAASSSPDIEKASRKANKLFDEAYQELLERSPSELSRTGSKKFYDRWDDLSPTESKARRALTKKWAKMAKDTLRTEALDAETKLSLTLFLYNAERDIAAGKFDDYDYPVNQMFGLHSEIPAFLINVHQVSSSWEAEAYIHRLERLPALFTQLNAGLKRREKKGIMPPRFVFDYVLSDVSNLLFGYPLTDDKAKKNPVFADFEKKVKALKLSSQAESDLLERGSTAMRTGFAPAYQSLQKVLLEQRTRASDEDGAWKFPEGAAYYTHQLKSTTTTNMTADEIHQLGLDEVARIHGEMRKILKQVGFKGDLQAFFKFMKEDPRFTYPNDAAGKKAYLDKAVGVVDKMKVQLDKLFLTKPKADLKVKAVEAFREKSAGKAFYESPALDGSRPGIYYANLYDMKSMPTYQMEALAYHEGIPGHHMQLSIAQELQSLPRFRRLGGYTAYIEGWGLYSERLPKEYGFYKDPYSDFGRLAMELWRACRLVVDTGIHHKKWDRQKATAYYRDNTPNALTDCQKMVDRHIVMPGQATAYKVGMNEILRLREKAKSQLGSRFDIREFHDVVLTHGAVPLAILEQLVDEYVATKKAK